MHYSNQKLSIIHYCKFKDFGNDVLVKDLNMLLSKSYNEETIPFQALKESAGATIEKKKNMHLLKQDIPELIKCLT